MIIFRYLTKELYTHLLAITMVLLIVFIINQFVHFAQNLVNGTLTMAGLLKIMSLQIPLLLGYLLPMGLYLAILIVFGRLYMDHEMVVLNACGVSKSKLLGMIMIFASLVFILVTLLMLWVEPLVEKYQLKAVNQALMSGIVERIVPNQFQTISKIGVVYVEGVSRKHKEMFKPFFAVQKTIPNSDEVSWDLTLADNVKDGSEDTGEEYLTFNHGERYLGVPGQLNYKAMSFEKYGMTFAFPDALRHSYNEIPTLDLWRARHIDPKANATLQWRFAFPISTILLVFLAMPLTKVNPRFGKYARLLPAILIYTVYADLLFLARTWIKNGTISPGLGMWWIHGAMIILAIILTLRESMTYRLQLWWKKGAISS